MHGSLPTPPPPVLVDTSRACRADFPKVYYLRPCLFYHATLWKRLGEITDLGTVDQDPCSFSSAINSKAQIVGASLPGCAFDSNTRAFLWQDGSIFDLNTLIPPGASLHLQWARDINDRGEIAGTGLDAEGN